MKNKKIELFAKNKNNNNQALDVQCSWHVIRLNEHRWDSI